MNNQKEKNKRLGALDVFIILALAACMVSVGLRFVSVRNSSVSRNVQMENYIVSFEVNDIRDSSAKKFMEKGTNFYLEDSNLLLGSLREGITISDSEKYYEMPNGEVVLAKNNSTGDLYRVDVEASLDCTGTMNEEGSFLLNGNQYIGINQELEIYSKYLAITIKITGITKAK